MSKRKAPWHGKTLKLPTEHGWHVSEGHKLFIADQGAVRFEYPTKSVVAPVDGDIAIGLFDRQPPDDDVRLAVSVMHLRQQVDWSTLPLDELVLKVMTCEKPQDAGRELTWEVVVRTTFHDGVETAWGAGRLP